MHNQHQQHKKGYNRMTKTDDLDIVYVVRPGESNEELRYSLRSIAKNMPHKRVIIAGYKPSWVKGVTYIANPQKGNKYENSRGNWRAITKQPDIKNFILFNDDFFVMQHTPKLPVYHAGSLTEMIAYYHSRFPGQAYVNILSRTSVMLERLGVPTKEQKSYALHVPMIMNSQKRANLREFAKIVDPEDRTIDMRTLYGNFYRLGGTEMADIKISRKEVLPDTSQTFLSTLDASFRDGKVGVYIRNSFPDKCRYEV